MMIADRFIWEVADFTKTQTGEDGVFLTHVPGLMVIRNSEMTGFDAFLYEPVVCLILQGGKETILQGRKLSASAGQALIVSHHVPVTSRIVDASTDRPYIALVMTIDLDTVRNLIEEVGTFSLKKAHRQAITAGKADKFLLEAMERLFTLSKRPDEIKVMAPLIKREIHYRILLADYGGILREMLDVDSSASRISRALELIRENYAEPMSVPELARNIGMSPSSFHEHFKLVTATTPLKYQKELRLIEAKRLLLQGSHSVSSVAIQVGYESPNQFSREFSRKFGASPRSIGNLQATA
ncbi:MAG: AraC family transcriptional regulator [Pseudomonadota bacterium]